MSRDQSRDLEKSKDKVGYHAVALCDTNSLTGISGRGAGSYIRGILLQQLPDHEACTDTGVGSVTQTV